jgi:Tol biopolymer transport system component
VYFPVRSHLFASDTPEKEQKMLTRTKVFSLTITALLVLTLAPGAPFGHAQGRPTTTAPPEPLNTLSNTEATEVHFSDFSAPSASSVVQNPLTPLSPGTTTRVSVASDGSQGNGDSGHWNGPSISADGRYVVFASYASNMVSGDTNGEYDVFVHDRQTGQTTRVSVASDGTQGNGGSSGGSWGAKPSISADGRYVAFVSSASNLVSGDTNDFCGYYHDENCMDVFVHDRQTGQTTRVSVASDGAQGNEESWNPSISADGRYVAFASEASNLVSGDTNDTNDAFVHDRQTGQTTRVSVASDGGQGNDWSGGPSISADGRYVAFESIASNLVSGDTNDFCGYYHDDNCGDIFIHDRQTGQTTRVSVASDGTQGNEESTWLSISADGRYVAFASLASNLVSGDTNGGADVFVHDRQTGQTTRVSVASDGTQGNGDSYFPSISADGRYVAFSSYAGNLVSGDTNGEADIFVHDRQTGQTTRVSVASDDSQGNEESRWLSISADGRYVAFASEASNLVSGDTNGETDVFVHDRGALCDLSKQPVLLVPGWGGSAANLTADDQLHHFRDWLGTDYAENCNLFYATGLSAQQGTWENALAIQGILRAAYDTRIALDPTWDGHIDIIGHSYGGVNSRAYLESDLYDQDQGYGERGIHVDNLFTLGTPHGGGTPELPGALLIAGGHIVDPDDWESLWQLTPWQMRTFNNTHSQPDRVCYRLVGGHAFEQDLPLWLRSLYGPFQFVTNDLGVYRWSAHELASWDDRYPHVLVGSTPDMHGYFDKYGLDQYRSFVYPSDTFDALIGPYLGAGLGQCTLGSQAQSSPAESTSSPPPVSSVLIASGAVVSGTVIAESFQVNWGDQSVFYLNWPLGDLNLILTDPDGDLIDPTTAQTDPNVGYFELDALAHTATYVFTDTLAGTWGYTITVASVPYTMPYRLIVLPSLPVAVTAQASPWQPLGQAVIISSTLTYSATTPLTGAAVQAFVSRPDGALDTLNLYDDGVHDDQAAGDGIYGNSYTRTNVGGFYAVVVEAAGVYQTKPYTRTAETYFSVATGAASLTGQYSDQPRDTNGDGRYEWLDVGMQISVTQVGTYTLAADLVGPGNAYIGHAMLHTGLASGTHSLTLSFDGDDILESEQDGPYTLTSVLLVDGAHASLLLDQADDAHVTSAYDHRQFGSTWRVYLPVILKDH